MTEPNETLINLSFSMHSGPGSFALLLGSGISQGAGVPTGWDIVRDLIRKLAALEGFPDIDDPEQWFREQYSETPKYSFLIDRIAPSQVERRNLLKRYIEPTREERESGLKVPSLAHKSIADLVNVGIIRIIITTNIDQLIENSLNDVGITPAVIFNDDTLNGAMPYFHNNCTIIKLHGDYMDTRIKNTPEELAQYSEKMNALLDRIFDEFGLVICGWSANWDVALRDALNRRINRRFSTYWAFQHELDEQAARLRDHLQAIPLRIEDADHFFQKLIENIESLKKIERHHPLSIPLAVSQVKKYLTEDKYRIPLHDLFQEETSRLYTQLRSDRFSIRTLQIPQGQTKIFFQNRMHEYEELLKLPIGMFTTYAYFGDSHSSKPIVDTIERLLYKPESDGLSIFVDLQYYPAYLLNYAIGIAALDAENYNILFSLFTKPRCNENGRQEKSLKLLNSWRVFSHGAHKLVPTPREDTDYYTPVSDYLCRFLYGEFRNLIPDRTKFEETFDVFEYIWGLTYIDQFFPELGERVEGPFGRFKWKYRRLSGIPGFISPIDRFLNDGIQKGDIWSLLQAGFFRGSVERLIECKSAYNRYLESVGQHW